MDRHVAMILLAVATLFVGTATAQMNWVRRFPVHSPSPRAGAAMAFDSVRGRAVLFGGVNSPQVCGDTWEWDGSDWICIAASVSPPPAHGCGMTFDSARGVTVLVSDSGTWEWNGVAWTLRDSFGISGRGLAYDSIRGVVVMVGNGIAGATPGLYPATTYEWNGQVWQSHTTNNGPWNHYLGAIVFDPTIGRCLLHVATLGASAPGWYQTGMYEWDGLAWTGPTGSFGLSYCSLYQYVFHVSRGTTVIYGGTATNHGFTNYRTREWTAGSTSILPTFVDSHGYHMRALGGRVGHAMVYDGHRDSVLLFGGFDIDETEAQALVGDTWELVSAPVVAGASSYGVGCGVPELALASQAGMRPIIGFTYTCDVVNGYPGSAFVAWGFSGQWITQHWALPLSLDSYGLEGCLLWTSGDLTLSSPCTYAGAATRYDFPVPLDQALVGAQVYLQAYSPQPGFNTLGVVTSNGLALTIGDT